MSNKPEPIPAQLPVNAGMMANDGDYSDSDGEMDPNDLDGGAGKGAAMMFDRSLVGDRNGLKTSILRAVYENQIHLQARKGEAFDHLAAALQKLPEFKSYHVHGRKLQKSFNKIARDIKDCIVAGNEPTRWGKEEPEFFTIARKIFEEARRAGIRAFDEKLKSKSMEDRIIDDRGDDGKRKRKRDFNTVMAESSGSAGAGGAGAHHLLAGHATALSSSAGLAGNPMMAAGMAMNSSAAAGMGPLAGGSGGDWMKALDDYFHAKLQEIRDAHAQNIGAKLTKAELEIALSKAVEQLAANGAKTISDLLNQAGISEQAKSKIYECGFNGDDEVLVFLLTYSDAIAKNAHPITSLREQFDNITARDASVLYSFIGKATK